MILYSGSLWSFAPKFGKLLIAIRFLDLDLMKKLYCYVDETGQDTQGKFFLVCVVVVDATFRDRVEKRLLAIEKRSKKGHVEWTRISLPKKNAYLQELLVTHGLKRSVFYSCFENDKQYLLLTVRTIVQVLERQQEDYQATILVHALSVRAARKMVEELKKSGVRYRKVRGLKAGSSCLIRLADSLAGFLRDATERKPYTEELYRLLTAKELVIKIQ